MSPDNAATPVENVPALIAEDGDYSALTDRELLERMARNMDSVLIIAGAIQQQMGPVLNSPMLKMFRGK